MKFPYEPRQIIEIDGKILVIYQWGELSEQSNPRVWENVQLLDHLGTNIWTVNGMERCQYWNNDKDTFVGVREKPDCIQLTSFSGNEFDLDIATGRVTFSEFHK